jgi:parallel beta-helix repeat protein
MSYGAGSNGTTEISLRETQTNWTFDSNETARLLASGGWNRKQPGNDITVAPSDSPETAEYYCTGTSDEVLINAALTDARRRGGGTVKCLRGNYYTGAAITAFGSYVSLVGESGTWINASGAFDIISCVGMSTAYFSQPTIRNIGLRHLATQATEIDCIRMHYTTNALIENVTCYDRFNRGINLYYCDSPIISNNIIDGNSYSRTVSGMENIGITVDLGTNYLITGNEIKGIVATNSNAVVALYFSGTASTFARAISNRIHDISHGAGSQYAFGIRIDANYASISNNIVQNVKNTATSTQVVGINIASGTGNVVSANFMFNNGADTGLANDNQNNYRDAGTDTQLV